MKNSSCRCQFLNSASLKETKSNASNQYKLPSPVNLENSLNSWHERASMLLNVVNLLRVRQWTKNLLVFLLPLSAGQVIGNNFSAPVLADSILLFFSLSFISSFNYAINDIIDIERDKIHFSKRHRPIASGALTVKNAFLVGFTSLAIGLIFAIQVNKETVLS